MCFLIISVWLRPQIEQETQSLETGSFVLGYCEKLCDVRVVVYILGLIFVARIAVEISPLCHVCLCRVWSAAFGEVLGGEVPSARALLQKAYAGFARRAETEGSFSKTEKCLEKVAQ